MRGCGVATTRSSATAGAIRRGACASRRGGGAPRMSRRDGVLLAVLLLFLAAVTAAWVMIDSRPPEWDHANHLERAVACHRVLADPGHDRVGERSARSSFYPPVVACAAGRVLFFF